MTGSNPRRKRYSPLPVLAALLTLPAAALPGEPADPAKPLKVFVLAGQSNMEGHAQVETFDYRTAVLSPSISRGVCDLTSIMQALGLAMGIMAKQKVHTKMWLRGFYLIFEEPGHYDVESGNRYRGERTRIMLGDIHKHFALRSRPGYPQSRRMALGTLTMQDVSTLVV